MSIAAQIPFAIGLLASAVVAGAWWYAALNKRQVAIFYWLAAAHTLSFGMHLLSLIYILTHAEMRSIVATGTMQTVLAVVLAGLYVALVCWLVKQPDSSRPRD